jgi:hypothetical protein
MMKIELQVPDLFFQLRPIRATIAVPPRLDLSKAGSTAVGPKDSLTRCESCTYGRTELILSHMRGDTQQSEPSV